MNHHGVDPSEDGIDGGLLAIIFDSSFMLLLTLYLNTHGSSRFGRSFLGGGSKLKSSYSPSCSDITLGYTILFSW